MIFIWKAKKGEYTQCTVFCGKSVFQWVKLRFGVKGNFGALVSNLCSQNFIQAENSRRYDLSLFIDNIFSHAVNNLLSWQQGMAYSQDFNLKQMTYLIKSLKVKKV